MIVINKNIILLALATHHAKTSQYSSTRVLVVVQNIDNHKHVSYCIDVHQYIDMYSLFSPILRVPPGYFPRAFGINLVLLPAGTPPKFGKSTGCGPVQVKASPGDRLRSYLEQNKCTSTVFIWVLVSDFIFQCLYPY